MLDLVDVGERSIESYRRSAGFHAVDAVREAAADLRGARVLEVNATPYGGGVSELLRSLVPLLNDLGLSADWRIISGDERFFQVTKAIHNGLQGDARDLTDADRAVYLEHAEACAAAFDEGYDFVVLHDPQPAALLSFRDKGSAKWIWRCHIDTSTPNPRVWRFMRPFLAPFDAAVFTMAQFVPPDLPVRRVEIVPPAIDPVSPKNLPLPEATAREILDWIGVPLRRPLVTQVARFDPWKDPMGVIAAARLAREDVPDLQLALVGAMALDDPQARDVYRQLRDATHDERWIHIFTNLQGVGNVEVNAFQTLSDVVVQKSLREGFGLVVSESLWKGTPVVAGRAGGIPLQMADGVGGFLIDGVEDCARAIVKLLRDPDLGRALGESGRARVRERFLIPRLVLNELALLRSLAAGRPVDHAAGHDPVCGMAVTGARPVELTVEGRTYRFCSERCRSIFDASPGRYLARR